MVRMRRYVGCGLGLREGRGKVEISIMANEVESAVRLSVLLDVCVSVQEGMVGE